MKTNETGGIANTSCQENNEVKCGSNAYYESTCSGSSDNNILDQHNESITLNDIIRMKLIKDIWQGKLIKYFTVISKRTKNI